MLQSLICAILLCVISFFLNFFVLLSSDEQQREFFSCMFAHSSSDSFCAGFSIHAKAEVILWVDGCTDDALLAVFLDSSTGLTCQSAVNKSDKEVCRYCYDFTTSFCVAISLAFFFVSHLKFVGQFLFGVDFSSTSFLLIQLQINFSVKLSWF